VSDIASFFGYSVMVAGGCLLIMFMWGSVVNYANKHYKDTRAFVDYGEAIREWKVNHPDKAKKYETKEYEDQEIM
jgi:hypothetical protein